MDKFSFLNSAHTSHFAEMYDQYLQSPDSLEPSWKAFFQGFDFGMETSSVTFEEKKFQVPENIKKEFQVVNLIDRISENHSVDLYLYNQSDNFYLDYIPDNVNQIYP